MDSAFKERAAMRECSKNTKGRKKERTFFYFKVLAAMRVAQAVFVWSMIPSSVRNSSTYNTQHYIITYLLTCSKVG